MIAQPNRHFAAETLRQLLDEALSNYEAERVEEHLSECERCRDSLLHIAGDVEWWHETVDVLSENPTRPLHSAAASSGSESSTTATGSREVDSSLHWIRPLLELCENGGFGRIDGYPVQGVIGQGGMGVVLRGTDPQLNRPVALKILSPHLAGVGAARARFMREAQSAASVVHPSIVPIYSVVTSARLPYLVMPCIGGGNLQQRIDREGPLVIEEVLRIGIQIAEGLSAAHRRGVIHRDIKPANILIEEGNGRVLITDFGLARALDDASLTVSGMIAGTPQYMSPEQARGETIDVRSDLFSLGSLLYALATGRPPFRADTPLAVLRKVTESHPRPIHEINERMPAWLDRLISRLMTIDVDDRIQSAENSAALLSEAHAHVCNPVAFPLPKSLTQSSKQFASIFTGMVLVSLIAGAAFVLNHVAKPSVNPQVFPQTIDAPHVQPTIPIQPEVLPWYDPRFDNELQSINRALFSLEQSLNRTAPTNVKY